MPFHSFKRLIGSVFFMGLLVSARLLGQTTYYVSAGGSDANDGRSQSTAWRSIAKLNGVTLSSGDAIFFRCGDEFQGQLNLLRSGITVGSYGAGNKPVISGAQRLSGWNRQGSIYVTRASALVKNLFINSVQMTLARYPNTGFVSVSGTDGRTWVTSGGISRGADYWKGANLRIRTADFAFETRTITSSSGGTLNLASATTLIMKVDWGFFVDNKRSELDAAGEWYCDPSTDSVYFYPPSGIDPNTAAVEGSISDYGVNSTLGSTSVTGLSFRCQNRAAIRFNGTVSNLNISNNDIFGSLIDGIRIEGTSTNCIIDGNKIYLVNNRGIALDPGNQDRISNNEIRKAGLVQGYTVGIDPSLSWRFDGATGIVVFGGSQTTISGNIIDSVGYIGIRPDGAYHRVENNVITNSMMKFADGGAIYICGGAGSTGGVWRNNIIRDVWGNNEGVHQPSWTTATGIYLDIPSTNMLVERNTIIRARGNGFFLHIGSRGDTLRDNLLYDCGSNPGGCFLRIAQDTTYIYGKHVITRNTFYPTDSLQRLIVFQEPWVALYNTSARLHCVGLMDNNYYCNPYNKKAPFQTLTYNGSSWVYNNQSLAGWKTLSNNDLNSNTGPQQISGQGSGSRGTTKVSTTINKEVVYVNAGPQEKLVNLGTDAYRDLDDNTVTGSITLPPFSSKILIMDSTLVKNATGVEQKGNQVPEEFNLFQNYPNPFNPSTSIRYALPLVVHVRLEVFDLSGRRIALLVDEMQQAGNYETHFDGTGIASGTYFYRIQAGIYSAVNRFVLLK